MTDTAFWDKIAPRYAKSPVSNPGAYEDTLARVRSHLGADDRVLELGAGTGSTALKLQDSVAHYVASDISSGMIDIARAKPGSETIEFRVAGVTTEEYADLDVDAVLAFNLLHLVRDFETSLAEIHAMLPENGLFISKTPAIGERWYFRPMIAVMQLFGKAPFVRNLKVTEIDAAIKAAGFRIVETGLYPPTTPSRFVVARKV